MFTGPLEGANRALDALRFSLIFNRSLRVSLASGAIVLPADPAPPPSDEWKKLDHAITVSRLYLVFESLVHECVSEWLDTLSNLVPYASLNDRVKATHRSGIGYILQNAVGTRFNEISVSNLIDEYYQALSGAATYKLQADAFLLHDRNLRVEDINTIFANCGLGSVSVSEWISNHRLTSRPECLQVLEQATVEKALAALVDLRNVASHATRKVTEVLGEDILIAYVDLIQSLCKSLTEAFSHAALEYHQQHGAWSCGGRINQVLKPTPTIVIAPLSVCSLSPGMLVFMRGKSHCVPVRVQEIQVNGVSVDARVIAMTPEELGLRFDVPGIKGSDLFIQTVAHTAVTAAAAGQAEVVDGDDQIDVEVEVVDANENETTE